MPGAPLTGGILGSLTRSDTVWSRLASATAPSVCVQCSSVVPTRAVWVPDSEKIGFPGRGGKQAGVCTMCFLQRNLVLLFKKLKPEKWKGDGGGNTHGIRRRSASVRFRVSSQVASSAFSFQGARSAEKELRVKRKVRGPCASL